MIKVQNIVKRYGATVAVDNVSFKAEAGEIVGFLGPNGAGKSTMIKILTCYNVADSGTATVAGHDVLEEALEVRRKVGYLPENTPLYPEMRVLDFLKFAARAQQLSPGRASERIDEVVGLTGIRAMLKKNIGHLSKGFRQRVGIAQSMMHDPPILILDEPTSGLDPHQIIEIRNLIRELGKTKLILFSSHIMQEISAICTRIIVIKNGKLVANGTPAELMKDVVGGSLFRVRVESASEDDVIAKVKTIDGVTGAKLLERIGDGGEFQIRCGTGKDIGADLFNVARDAGWSLSRLHAAEGSLEDLYLELTAA